MKSPTLPGSEEIDAYAAETQLGLATIGLSPRWNEFVKTNDKYESVVDKEAIKKKVDEWYKGWYEADPLKEYEQNAGGGVKIDYGKEDEIKGWECKCPKESYYYDYAYRHPETTPRCLHTERTLSVRKVMSYGILK